MKVLLPASVSIGLLDSSGASFKVTVDPTKYPSKVSILESDGTSYSVLIKESNTYAVTLLESDGTSYKLEASVAEKPSKASTVIPTTRLFFSISVSYVIKEWNTETLTFGLSYKNRVDEDTLSYTSRYDSGYKSVEKVTSTLAFNNGFHVSTASFPTHFNIDLDKAVRNFEFRFKISYGVPFRVKFNPSYTIFGRLTAPLPISYNSYDRLKKEIELDYCSYHKVSYTATLSYNITQTIFPVKKVALVSYAINPSYVFKTLGVSYNNYDSIAVVTPISYRVSAYYVTKLLPISYTSTESLRSVKTLSYAINPAYLIKSVPLSYTSLDYLKKYVTTTYSINPYYLSKSVPISYNSFEYLVSNFGISYSIKPAYLSKSVPISYNSFEYLVSNFGISYSINPAYLSKVLPISYNSFEYLAFKSDISYSIKPAYLSKSVLISYNSFEYLVSNFGISYSIKPYYLSKSVPISYNSFEYLVSNFGISYSINPAYLSKVLPVSYNSFEYLAFKSGISYSINPAYLSKSVPISYNSFDYIHRSTGISYNVNSSHVIKLVSVAYNSFEYVKTSIGVVYTMGVVRLIKSICIDYTNFVPVLRLVELSYNVRKSLVATFPISYDFRSRVSKSAIISYNSTMDYRKDFSISYDIKSINRVEKKVTLSYFSLSEIITVINPANSTVTLPDGTTIPAGSTILRSQNVDILEVEPLLVIGGEIIYVLEMTVSVDEGNYTYSLDATLASYVDLVKFEANKPFYVVLQGEVYSFVVDSRNISREEVNAPQAKIRGLSPTSRFTGPRSKQILGTTFSESLTARGIIDKLLYDPKINYTINDSSGDLTPAQAAAVGIEWNIQDWHIPPYRFGAENTYPLDSVKTIVEAVGGLVEATPDGNICIRYKHPTRVPDYSDAVIAHTFTDNDDIISIQENHAPNRMVNAVYVKTYQDMGIQDQIEYFDVLSGYSEGWDDADAMGGIVRVFPAIWKDAKPDLSHNRNTDSTLDSEVQLIYQGVEYWNPNERVGPDYGWETIDIVKSQGTTRYPMTKVLGYVYGSDNAGEIIINDYSKTFYTKSEDVRYSILLLKYQTKCHRWKLVAPGGTHIQFKIRDTVYNTYLR